MLVLLLFAFASLIGSRASAADLDVCSSCSHATIEAAVQAAADGDRIRIAQGTYPERLRVSASLTLSGGWTDGFTSQSNDPDLTIIDGGGIGRPLRVDGRTGSTVNLALENLTLANGLVSTYQNGGGLWLDSTPGPIEIAASRLTVRNCASPGNHGGGIHLQANAHRITARFDRLLVHDNEAQETGGGMAAFSGATEGETGECDVTMTNSIIASNTTGREAGGLAIWAQEGGTTRVTLLHCTITANASSDDLLGGGGMAMTDDGDPASTLLLTAVNTIVYGNTAPLGADFSLAANGELSQAELSHIDLGTLYVWAGTILQTSNLSVDPGFVDPERRDFHLTADSPLVDQGILQVPDPPGLPAVDFDGHPRLVGDAPDIGADEYSPPETVTLSAFTAEAGEDGVLLAWTTASEEDHLGFHVQRAEVLGDAAPLDYERVTARLLTSQANDPGSYSFADRGVQRGASYDYRLEAVDRRGRSELFPAIRVRVPPAAGLTMHPSRPNPFHAMTAIVIESPEGPIRARIVDANGRLVREFNTFAAAAGRAEIVWDGRDGSGSRVPAGVYFCRVQGPTGEAEQKLILAR